ncbi:MAG TPA: translation initiation factor IF-3 [Candidatus Saccharimonadales bacterium]|nr:translation initiation factor IF-3 [Candidatus Saccharimonadales bacterium]
MRINDRIRVPQVRVVGADGQQVGLLATQEALEMARSAGLDLVEVSPTSRPPVCRIMDYGKFKYEQSKRQRKAKKHQHVTRMKEVKLRPKIEEHDYTFKVQHARAFLLARDKVKVSVTFRGRELAHQDLGHKMLQRVITDLAEVGQVEVPARMEGRILVMVMIAKPGLKIKSPKEGETAGAVPASGPPSREG